MEGNVHAVLLLGTVGAGVLLCWRNRGWPDRRRWVVLRAIAAIPVFIVVWALTAGMFQCLCGPGNNPVMQGVLPAFMAAAATVTIRAWKPMLSTIALMTALGYGLSWHFHWLVLEQTPETQQYVGADMFEDMRPEASLWHTPLTALYRNLPPLPRESELHRAARERNAEEAKRLIAAGAPVGERSRDGQFALQLAASRNAVDIVALLLDAGAAVNAADRARETALHHAALTGALQSAELLLARGAAVNARSTNGATPLCHAASKGHLAVVELLLAKGADSRLKQFRASPLALAIGENRKLVAILLIAKGADVTEDEGNPLLTASHKGNLEMVQLLVAHGADVNKAMKFGAPGGEPVFQTPLGVAKSEEVRQFLIAHGAKR